MADPFSGSTVGPNEAGLVVVVEVGWERGIRKNNAEIGKCFGKMSKSHGELSAFVGGVDFGLARAVRGFVLSDDLPCVRTPHTVNDGATHTAKFEERNLGTCLDRVSDLGSPIYVAIGS